MSGDGAIANERGEEHKANTKAKIIAENRYLIMISPFDATSGIEGERFWCIYTRYIGITAPLLFNIKYNICAPGCQYKLK